MKKRKRYEVRAEADGTSSVLDIFTGQPTFYIGKTMWKIDDDLARVVHELLNFQDQRRRATLKI